MDNVKDKITNSSRTICEIHREIYDVLIEEKTIDPKIANKLIDLLEDAYKVGKKIDGKLRQYKFNYDDGWWEQTKENILKEKRLKRKGIFLGIMKTISVEHYNNKITLVKDGNIKLRIDGTDKKIYKAIFYESEDSMGNQNARCIYDSPILYNGWNCSETLDYNSDTYPNKISIRINGEMGWFVDFIYDKHIDEFYRINNIRNEKILNNVIDPIIITGAPGGGTSYITKLLKYRGFYCGTDSGNFNIRKNHESITFTSIKETTCFYQKKFITWFTEEDILLMKKNVIERMGFYTAMFKNQLEYKFENFWGNAPNNCIWGWKDPTVSILLPIWKSIFPSCKLMIIKRNKEKLSENIIDSEGDWFRNNDNILKYFYEPDISDFSKDDVFYCDFNKVVTDIKSMNEMFDWIGLDALQTSGDFFNLLKETGYEGKIN